MFGVEHIRIYIFKSFLDDSDVCLSVNFGYTINRNINNCLTGNIFISRTSIPNASSEDGDEDEWISNKVIFKIGKKER